MIGSILSPVREAWTALQDTLYFLPPFPARIDTLALLSLLLVSGLLLIMPYQFKIVLEALRRRGSKP